MHKLNVLVAGSTGYIGIQLIKLFCNLRSNFWEYFIRYTAVLLFGISDVNNIATALLVYMFGSES